MWVKRWIYVEEPSSGTTSTTETANYGTTRLATNNTTTTDGYTKIVCFGWRAYWAMPQTSNDQDIDEVWLGIIDRYNREGQKRDQKEARQFYNRIVQNFQVGCIKTYKGMYNKKLMFPNKKVEKWV